MSTKLKFADIIRFSQSSSETYFHRLLNGCKDVIPPMSKEEYIKSNVKQLVVVQVDELDSLLRVPGSCKYRSDTWLLNNEDRLSQINSPAALLELRKRFEVEDSSPNVFEGFSDEEIAQTIKDRDIQTPSELKAWFNYLGQSLNKTKSEFKELVDELKDKSVSSDEPSPSEDKPSVVS